MAQSSLKLVIVGGGVNGFCCGVNILESLPNIDVTIVSELLSPNTTGDNAAGLCLPFAVGRTPTELIRRFFKGTFEFCGHMMMTGEAATAGIFPQSGFYIGNSCSPHKDVFLTYEDLSDAQIKRIMPTVNSKGAFLTTYVLEGKAFIGWLSKKFSRLGGKVEIKKVKSLSELSSKYDMIVNCAGLGAQQLANDDEVYPSRGQVIKVKAPFIKHFFMDMRSPVTYIIPTSEIVTVGGTIQNGDYDTNVDLTTKKRMMDNACRMVPNLKNCEFVADWVGLRPGRSCIRVEKEMLQCNGRRIPVIHNYGHGGSGLSFSWGCSKDVVSLIKQELTKFSSRL